MIKCTKLRISSGDFYVHYYQGESKKLFVFIPGLMEPKAGLFYFWHHFGKSLFQQGHSALFFDLAGQGDSLLPFCFSSWTQQREAIRRQFYNYEIHLIARGIGSILLCDSYENHAIMPSTFDCVSNLLTKLRWTPSPMTPNYITPKYPTSLTQEETHCFHLLGAESECIGNLEIPETAFNNIAKILPKKLPENTRCYSAGNDHPLFKKLNQRESLIQTFINNLY